MFLSTSQFDAVSKLKGVLKHTPVLVWEYAWTLYLKYGES